MGVFAAAEALAASLSCWKIGCNVKRGSWKTLLFIPVAVGHVMFAYDAVVTEQRNKQKHDKVHL